MKKKIKCNFKIYSVIFGCNISLPNLIKLIDLLKLNKQTYYLIQIKKNNVKFYKYFFKAINRWLLSVIYKISKNHQFNILKISYISTKKITFIN